MKTRRKFLAASLLAAGSLLSARSAFAHGNAKHGGDNPPGNQQQQEQQEWGIAGDARKISRTIPITMTDEMRFIPDRIEVRLGETVRFLHHNVGKVMHEMVLGTKPTLDEHAELMERFPDMEHDAPWMTHVAPGGRGEIIWTFNRPGNFDFACLIPGHYQAGMVGRVVVSKS